MTNEKSFVKGTIILAASGLAVKLLSAVYRIPLTRMLGAQAIGGYTAAFNIFMPFFAVATAGITPAVSRLCAMQKTEENTAAIKKQAGGYFAVTSLIFIALALITGGIYSEHIETPMIFIGVALLCPNLFFATFEAVYKGISQGTMNMAVTAKANILESAAKAVIGIGSVYLAGKYVYSDTKNIQTICAFATISISGIICWVYMRSDFLKNYGGQSADKKIFNPKQIFSMAVPISVSALITSGANFFDTVICLSIVKNIPDTALMAAYPFISFSGVQQKAIWLFGVYQGLCLTVINLIPSISAAIGASGLPVITRTKLNKNDAALKRQVSKLLKFTAVSVVPISLFVMFFSYEVIITLFGDDGAQTVLAAKFLRLMAPVAILSAFAFPLNSILHALEKSAVIMKIVGVSCAVKVAVSYFLCSDSKINIMGCLYSTALFSIIIFFMSVYEIKKSGLKIKIISTLALPIMSSYVILTFLRFFADFTLYNVPTFFKTCFCGMIFVLTYIIIIIFSGYTVDMQGT